MKKQAESGVLDAPLPGATAPAGPAEPPLQRPANLAAVYWGFTAMALQGFGGVLAVVQREMVERRRWIGRTEFVEQWAVAQVLPGPNVVNLALMLGDRFFGLRGALAALAGMLSIPLVIVLLLVAAYAPWAQAPAMAGALRGMGAVSAGLIAAAGLKLLPALQANPLPVAWRWALMLATLGAVTVLRLPLVAVIFGMGALACWRAWHALAAADTNPEALP